MNPPGPETPESSHQQFVAWMRQVTPYMHRFHGATVVVTIPGELVAAGRLEALIQDLSLLVSIGMKVVLVNGCRPQIDEQLRLRGAQFRIVDGLRVTDQTALHCAKEAAGAIRLTMEAGFSQGLPNTPMQDARIRVVSGNYVTARPIGIVNGVDFQYSGLVRKVDATAIRAALDTEAVVLASNIGFSPTGEAFNLQIEEVAQAIAVSLGAQKLVYLMETPGLVIDEGARVGDVVTEISLDHAKDLLERDNIPDRTRRYLRSAVKACEAGVPRTHLLSFDVDGQILLEFFLHDGIGTMVVPETLKALREATHADISGILALIQPLEEQGILVKRDRTMIEAEIENFSVIEHDRVLFGCAALYAFPEDGSGEMACVAVHPEIRNRGDGERLLLHIEQRARAQGLHRLFVLTTRTTHWFLQRGFVLGSVDDLPTERKGLYNFQRKSQVLVKEL